MNRNAKRISITRELHEIIIVRRGQTVDGFCGSCGEESEFLSLDAAVSVYMIATRRILDGIETKTIHSLEAATGHLLVCRRSLANLIGGVLK